MSDDVGGDWKPGQGHYPYQTGIEAYGNGGFRFAGMSHRGSILCLPDGMHAWSVTGPSQLSLQTLAPALEAPIEVLFIGTGEDIAFVSQDLRAAFREKGIVIEPIATGGAVRTYNVLLNEDRSVGAALIAVEKAR